MSMLFSAALRSDNLLNRDICKLQVVQKANRSASNPGQPRRWHRQRVALERRSCVSVTASGFPRLRMSSRQLVARIFTPLVW